MEIATRFGKNLRRCRKRAKLSQEDLAHRASLHRTAVGLVERGDRVPRIDTLVKLASALAVTSDELLDGIDWKPAGSKEGEFVVLAPEHETK